jgi:poly-gamma-glutamate capsule biosynthesis protein CapA/YwtB (metallophosphatase superfamily)
MSNRKFQSVFLFVLLSLFFSAACQPKTVKSEENVKTPLAAQTPQTTVDSETLTIAAVGDIMLGSPFPNETRMPPNDGADNLKDVTPILERADIAFGNLEGPLADGGISEKCGTGRPNCYAFRMPTHYGKYLKDAGFDVLSLANNHAADFGDAGRESTRETLDRLGIKHAGSDKNQFSTAFLQVKGKTVAFIGFAHNNLVPNVNDLTFARQLVLAADKKADIVVVSFHGGAEGAANQRVPKKTEIFFGEKRGNLPLFSRTVIDAGADLVLGHGPHVLRGMEIYKDRLIAYSLGNFATYGWFKLIGGTAESLILEVELDTKGKFLGGKIHPVIQQDWGIPRLDKTNSAVKTIRGLSKSDFGINAPEISGDGTISPK